MSNKLMNFGDKDYVPEIKIQNFAPKGHVSRIKGKTTNRVHHLLSDEYTFTTIFVVTLRSNAEEKYLDLSIRNETELYRDLLLYREKEWKY